MNNFLVNMAVIKVNWDTSNSNILDNYMPLVRYTLKNLPNKVVSSVEFIKEFEKVAEFHIPTSAMIYLLKRAEKKYKYVNKTNSNTYEVNLDNLAGMDYEKTRDQEQRKFQQLKDEFIKYCNHEFDIQLDKEEVDSYFFEILYEIAPHLFRGLSEISSIKIDHSQQKKYHVSKFIAYAVEKNHLVFEAIESFVRGAMLTETFYYSSPENYTKKITNLEVYFDTQFLVRALGFCDDAIKKPCLELVEMLSGMSVKMRYFEQTFTELNGILFAVEAQLNKYKRIRPNRPGDVFDYFSQKNATSSDLRMILSKLEERLQKLGIYKKAKPRFQKKYNIDEIKLENVMKEEQPSQSEQSRIHDIECISSIFQLREGSQKDYLESSNAIFITTNFRLVKMANSFFKEEYGPSNISVCMGDQVFTTLIWLKAVKKIPNLPKDRLVANCNAALLPSDVLWEKYIKEAEKLQKQGDITTTDYDVLVHDIGARSRLMDITYGDVDVFVEGTVEDVLMKAKETYNEELINKLEQISSDKSAQETHIDDLVNKLSKWVEKTLYWGMIIIIISFLIYGVIYTSPDGIQSITIENIKSFNMINIGIQDIIFIVFVIVSTFAMVFGKRLSDYPKKYSASMASRTKYKLYDMLKVK